MQIVPRSAWEARPESLPHQRMILPATAVWIHHSVSAVSRDPAKDMRAVEAIGIKRFGQFSYSFCIHPDGSVLEGCGDRVGAHTAGKNSTSFGISWLGDYTTRIPKVQQIDATRWLIAWLIERRWLRAGTYPTGGHRDLKPTACPGDKLYAILDDLRVPWTAAPPEPPQEVPVADEPNKMQAPLLAFVPTPTGKGYWMVSVTGEVHSYGDAEYFGRSEAPRA